jgi:hypothetical protein
MSRRKAETKKPPQGGMKVEKKKMGAFSKFQKAKAANGPRVRFELGQYLTAVSGVKFDKTRKGDELFAVSFRIVESSSSAPSMNVGGYADWAAMSSWDSYEGLVKDFVGKLYGIPESALNELPEEEFEELMEALTGAPQAASGRLVRVESVAVTNKAGEDAVAVRFVTVPEAEQPAGHAS